jgi:geranylgeranyl pyrophosphate synthase
MHAKVKPATDASILVEKTKGVATITLNRPKKYNALSTEVLREVEAALLQIAKDDSVRVVVIAANGAAFSSGHDLKEMMANRTQEFIGDLFDNLIDHELSPSWHTRDPAEANLAAATLLTALPQLSVARLREQGTPPARLWALTHLFAETLLTMSAGEHEDMLVAKRENVGLKMCRTTAERKSGSEFALFTTAGAMLATEDPVVIEDYAAFGLCLGTAGQICSDVGDIWSEGISRDLLNGERTLPIVHALYALRGASRERLQELLVAVRESAGYYDEVRTLLAAAGSIHYTTLVVEIYLQRARNHLATASPREPAGQVLRMLLDGTSLLSAGDVASR